MGRVVPSRNKSLISVVGEFLYVLTNNTQKQYKFNYSEQLLNNLKDIGWYEDSDGYLSGKVDGERFRAYWFVVGVPLKGMVADHINHDKTDNTEGNLRIVTHSQNMANKSKYKSGKTCHYKGVCWHKQHKKWYAQIQKDNKNVYLGLYLDPREAAEAYDRAAIMFFGEYAATNVTLGLMTTGVEL